MCKGYITEKFWVRALQNKIVPVVMNKAEMTKIAPQHSSLNVEDFDSPKVLQVKVDVWLLHMAYQWMATSKY